MEPPSRLLVVNGPNLNLLGTRRPDIYGTETLDDLEADCRTWAAELKVRVDTFQSNHEGAIIDRLHEARRDTDAVIINPGALTHYSFAIYDALEAIELPTVEVHISDITRREAWRRESVIAPACVATIYGRGTAGYRDALRHLVFRAARPPATLSYGSDHDQVGDLRIPAGPGPHPVIGLVHGGFWRRPWQRDLMDGLAVDLVERGVASWNVEYRRGPGAWIDSLSDTAAAVDYLAFLAADHHLNVDQVALVGHSAGGHLALWAAGRAQLPGSSPWPAPIVTPRLVISLAGVLDLVRGAGEKLGDGAVEEFFGGPPDETGSPSSMLPLGVPQLVVHGSDDDRVPVEHSRAYVERARGAGDVVDFVELAGADHSVLVDEQSPEWGTIATAVVERLKGS